MNVIVCVEDKMGMLFNKRRVSQDSVLRERLRALIGEKTLFVSAYTEKQFREKTGLAVCEDFDALPAGEFCFVEDPAMLPKEENTERLYLYRWNRRYPADRFFGADLSKWNLEKKEDFQGSSHEKITEEVYSK